MSLANSIQEFSSQFHQNAIDLRRHIHANPELSFHEEKTAAFIASELTALNIPHQVGVGGHGIVATIKGQSDIEIALRADMDALPIVEVEGRSYGSKVEGVMHACGHDVHTASLLSTARILNEIKSELPATVRLIFQPAEESLPGGASIMIKEGALENPVPQSIFGQHVHPLLEVGKVGFRPGKYMASADEIHMEVNGRGGHAAMPHQNIDPVLITSHMIVALQQMVSRFIPADLPAVLSFGHVIAQGATNVIPDTVSVKGTFRILNEEWRDRALAQIKHLAESTAKGMGGSVDVDIRRGYPYLQNDEQLTNRAMDYAREYLGSENVVDLDIWMGGEDFAYYSQEIPACFYRLGVRNEAKGIIHPVHSSSFDIDESALSLGPGLMAWMAVKEMQTLK